MKTLRRQNFVPNQSILTFLGAALCALIVATSRAENPPNQTPTNKEPIVLDALSVTAVREKLTLYQVKVDDLYEKTQLTKKISYLDAILTAYDCTRFDLMDVLLKKKRYRDLVAKDRLFFCNYAAINLDIPVVYVNFDQMRGISGNYGGLRGVEYRFKTNTIRIAQGGETIKVLHGSGASLCGSPAPEMLPKIEAMGRQKKDTEYVEEILFEVRLQDLNRFYGIATGHPIMTPLEALEAIILLGEKPKTELVKKILDRTVLDVPEAEIAQIIDKTKEGKTSAFSSGEYDIPGGQANFFNYASRLIIGARTSEINGSNIKTPVILEDGLQTLSGKAYEEYLERILIEAPGHI